MENYSKVGQGYAGGLLGQTVQQEKSWIQSNPEKLSLRENVQARIEFHKREIATLETALKNITEKPLSEITIGDLNIAMRY
jgi:phage tail tape-measure protein